MATTQRGPRFVTDTSEFVERYDRKPAGAGNYRFESPDLPGWVYDNAGDYDLVHYRARKWFTRVAAQVGLDPKTTIRLRLTA